MLFHYADKLPYCMLNLQLDVGVLWVCHAMYCFTMYVCKLSNACSDYGQNVSMSAAEKVFYTSDKYSLDRINY